MRIETPFGPAWIAFNSEGAVTEFLFGKEAVDEGPANHEALRQIEEYFAGTRREFDIPLAPKGTSFQKRVWEELCRIPFGETISYGELALRVGSVNGFRAVGQANGRNPISLIIPCHRVIGSDGSLTGYGGGIETKRLLLEFETGRSWSPAAEKQLRLL